MARIDGVPKSKAGLLVRLAYWRARRHYGRVTEPLMVLAHHKWISRGYFSFKLALGRSCLVEKKLKTLAVIKVATMVGCPF